MKPLEIIIGAVVLLISIVHDAGTEAAECNCCTDRRKQ